jgi:hypothetical protein
MVRKKRNRRIFEERKRCREEDGLIGGIQESRLVP